MDQSDRDYCQALLARYFRRFADALRRGEWGRMQFCHRRILALKRWQQEWSQAGDSTEV